MKLKCFLLTASFGLALIFTFSCSGSDDNASGEQKCGGVVYDPNTYHCELGELIGKCKGVDYYPAYQQCVGGVVVDGGSSSSSVGSSSSSVASVGSSSSVKSNSSILSSSSIATSSSSAVLFSSSTIIQSSSSIAPSSNSVVVSSSSITISSSSVELSSSSVDLCADFATGTKREHYGKEKKQFCDSRDGIKYVYVTIGSQTWMAENLNYAVEGSKCGNSYVNNATCDKYGKLYNWATAMALPSDCTPSSCASQIEAKHRGICSSGWHIPSDAEWTILTDFAGGGVALKATSGWNYYSSDVAGQDIYGFAALPGGYNSDGKFSDSGRDGYWYASNAYYRRMGYAFGSIIRNNDGNGLSLFSIRCIQD